MDPKIFIGVHVRLISGQSQFRILLWVFVDVSKATQHNAHEEMLHIGVFWMQVHSTNFALVTSVDFSMHSNFETRL